jgi:dimethylhistidine N-methyltransferase
MPAPAGDAALAPPQAGGIESFREAVISGLSRPRKAIACKYFYDEVGGRLFDRICRLPEYYPTRTELRILREHGEEIARCLPADAVLVEWGSGASRKAALLLERMHRPAAYVPIDVSPSCLAIAARFFTQSFPRLCVAPVHGDFTRPLMLPKKISPGPRVGFFPGSTLGNFDPPDAARLLARFAATLGPGGLLVLGVDLKKDARILHAAYNDTAGVTAAFNMNLLHRANRQLAADFDVAAFAHRAIYQRAAGRIEMHLVSLAPQTVAIGRRRFAFAAGETIHTENSYKYAVEDVTALAARAGLARQRSWLDRRRMFSVHLLACR